MTDKQKLIEFLGAQSYMVVAVVAENKTPWAVPVRILHQEGKVFEWDSHRDTVHSQAIVGGSPVAITIFSTENGQQFGFYAEGSATFTEKSNGFARYRFVATKAYINDETFVKREVQL